MAVPGQRRHSIKPCVPLPAPCVPVPRRRRCVPTAGRSRLAAPLSLAVPRIGSPRLHTTPVRRRARSRPSLGCRVSSDLSTRHVGPWPPTDAHFSGVITSLKAERPRPGASRAAREPRSGRPGAWRGTLCVTSHTENAFCSQLRRLLRASALNGWPQMRPAQRAIAEPGRAA